tara:strand:- start:853 stop:1266 length:414 start_codon:yes stop_codon:yes gene_type:complete
MSAIKLQGNSSGAGTSVLQSANTASTLTQTLPSTDAVTLGYLNIPSSATTGTLVAADVGKFLPISATIIIPASIFAAGDVVSLYNNSASTKTITCSAVTTKIAGSDTTVTSATLAIRGVATVLFIDATNCVLTGNVS